MPQTHQAPKPIGVFFYNFGHLVVVHISCARLNQRLVDPVSIHMDDQIIGDINWFVSQRSRIELRMSGAERDGVLSAAYFALQLLQGRKSIYMHMGINDHRFTFLPMISHGSSGLHRWVAAQVYCRFGGRPLC